MKTAPYVLITAAYNEERLLPRTMESILSQTVIPLRWTIVSDASTDGTDDIVTSYARNHPFITLLRIHQKHRRNFGAQVVAINAGYESVSGVAYRYIGNIDADITLEPTYFETLLRRFDDDHKLGLAGGVIEEQDGARDKTAPGEILRSVPHALQLFRKACYEDVGGYPVLRFGGPDAYAEITARMKGWNVRGFPDLIAHHHRYTASEGGHLRGRFRQGLMEFSLGYHPAFECAKCVSRIREKPFLAGACGRLMGYFAGYAVIRKPLVPSELRTFLRREQMGRMRALIGRYCPSLSRTTG